MPYRTRVTSVGLLLAALTSGMAQALPPTPQSRPVQRAETGDLLAFAADWLSSLFRLHPTPADTAGDRGKFGTVIEKIASQLDPDGHH